MNVLSTNKLSENILLQLGDLINGTEIVKQLNYWRKISLLTESEINALAERNLVNILKYANKFIPFYSKIKTDFGKDVKSILSDFPVLYKIDIKKNLNDIISKDHKCLIKYSSSGSSGIQSTVFMNKKEQSIIRAIMLLWWEWAGYEFGKKTIQTGITPNRGLLKFIKDFLFRIDYVSAFDLSETEIKKILTKYKHKKNLFFAGYPSSLNVLAEIALKNSFTSVRFDSAICWGDKLFDKYKKNIKDAFGCDVKEVYSCNEGFLVGAKKDLDYFYIMSPHVYIEIVDKEGKPVPDGELGYVLLTRLDGFSMPLIRYYVGDLAIKLPREKYPEKREMFFPLLEKVIGRDTDIVVTPSGKRLIVHFFTGIFEFVPEIKQFMVIQRDISEIEIHYIPNTDFNSLVLERLEKIFYDKLKEKLNVSWRAVDHIPSTASGKPQLIRSFIGKV